MLIISLSILLCLGFICYQDMRYRAVYWICFPVLAALLFVLKQQEMQWKEALIETGYGIVFFGTQLVLLWIYFSLKNRKLTDITSGYLGLGDILFLMAITFYLSPVNYILFYIGSLIVVLIYTLGQRIFLKKEEPEIPLAGLQALLLGLVLIVSIVQPGLQPTNDSWIYGL